MYLYLCGKNSVLSSKIFFFIEHIFFLLGKPYRANIFYIKHLNFTDFKTTIKLLKQLTFSIFTLSNFLLILNDTIRHSSNRYQEFNETMSFSGSKISCSLPKNKLKNHGKVARGLRSLIIIAQQWWCRLICIYYPHYLDPPYLVFPPLVTGFARFLHYRLKQCFSTGVPLAYSDVTPLFPF